MRADGMAHQRKIDLFSLSIFWFAWEVQWAALLGAALVGQIARFFPAEHLGTATAVLLGSGAFLSIASQFGSGWLSDRLGRHMVLIAAGSVADIAGLFGFAYAPSFAAVVVTFAVIQIAFNAAGGPYQALMPSRVSIDARSRASAVMGLFRLSGNAAGLLVAKVFVKQPGPGVSALDFRAGLEHLSLALSVIILVALAITLAGVRDVKMERPRATDLGQWPAKKSFAWLIASRTAVSMGLYLILPFFAFYLRFVHNVSNYLHASLNLLLIMTACALAGTVPAGIAGDRIAKKKILFAALGVLAAGAVCLSLTSSIAPVMPLAMLLGIGWGAYYAVDWALACVLLPPGRAGALMAVWNIGASAPQVAAPIVGGLLVDRVGIITGDLALGYRLLFALIAACVALGAGCLAFVRENRAGLAARSG